MIFVDASDHGGLSKGEALRGFSGDDPSCLWGIAERTAKADIGERDFFMNQIIKSDPFTVGPKTNPQADAKAVKMRDAPFAAADEIESDRQVFKASGGPQDDIDAVQGQKRAVKQNREKIRFRFYCIRIFSGGAFNGSDRQWRQLVGGQSEFLFIKHFMQPGIGKHPVRVVKNRTLRPAARDAEQGPEFSVFPLFPQRRIRRHERVEKKRPFPRHQSDQPEYFMAPEADDVAMRLIFPLDFEDGKERLEVPPHSVCRIDGKKETDVLDGVQGVYQRSGADIGRVSV